MVDPELRFEQIYRAYASAVRTYARRRSDAQTADDVVADVFVVAWRRLDAIPPEDPLPWLLGVARRTLANQRRTARRHRALRSRIANDRTGTCSAAATAPTEDRAAWDALGRLNDQDREALLLVAWEGLSPGQAAVVLGIRPNTFSARLSRARRRFEVALETERDAPAGASEPTNAEASR